VMPNMAGIESNANSRSASPIAAASRSSGAAPCRPDCRRSHPASLVCRSSSPSGAPPYPLIKPIAVHTRTAASG